jgi:hypothetical protein
VGSNGKAWLGAIGIFVGLITGGLGSAAVGSNMYNRLETRFEEHVTAQTRDEIESHERLARIETLLEEIRDELRK